ncbi:MAG TPA: M20 family metallopeptidase [Bacillota bacterium]
MNLKLIERLNKKIDQIIPGIVTFRQQMHSDPEIGLETYRTKARIRQELANTAVSELPSYLGADFVGELKGKGDGLICLRADTDGLPITETTGLPYSSKTSGLMHACGHDGHTAILIGVALVLDYFKEYLCPTVRFIFQPGEEVVCGGKKLVASGGVAGVQACYALHGWPGLPVGVISTRPGVLFAAGATFTIELLGQAAHGAMPEQGNNPIPVVGVVLDHLGKMSEKEKKANGSIISVCSVNAGQSATIIPAKAVIKGTARYLEPDKGRWIEEEIKQIVADASNKHKIQAKVFFDHGYAKPVKNSEAGFQRVATLVQSYLPAGVWRVAQEPTMVCEDFAYYLNSNDGCMFFLGLGEDSPKLHSGDFDFNDTALKNGILTMSLLALSY